MSAGSFFVSGFRMLLAGWSIDYRYTITSDGFSVSGNLGGGFSGAY